MAPVTEMLDADIAVGLGTDSVASNNRMDLLDEGRLVSFTQRIRSGSHGTLPAGRIIELATLGSARALGMDATVGSLEVGKAADIAAFALDTVADAALYDPGSALVFGPGGRRAELVLVAGVALVRDGALVRGIDQDLTMLRETVRELARVE